jgi:hypothetical protein
MPETPAVGQQRSTSGRFASGIRAFVSRASNHAYIIEACVHQQPGNIALERLPWTTQESPVVKEVRHPDISTSGLRPDHPAHPSPHPQDGRRRLDEPSGPDRRRDHRALAAGVVGSLWGGGGGVARRGRARPGPRRGELRGRVSGSGKRVKFDYVSTLFSSSWRCSTANSFLNAHSSVSLRRLNHAASR